MKRLVIILGFVLCGLLVSGQSYPVSTVLDTCDLSAGDTTFSLKHFTTAVRYKVQLTWSSLTGTLNGNVKLQESIDGTNYYDISGQSDSLTTAAGGSIITEEDYFDGYIRAVVDTNGITGGRLTVKIIADKIKIW